MSANIDLLKGKVVYLVLTAASKIRYTDQIIQGLISLGAKVVILSTPNARDALINLKLDKSLVTIIEREREEV